MSRPLDSYPQPFGARMASVFPHTGPSSYTQITVGTPPTPATGGDTVQAGPEAGFKTFDYLVGGESDSGNYRVTAIPINKSGSSPGQQSTTYRLRWIATRTATIGGQSQTANTEAAASTDLSAEIVRLFALGTN